MPSALHNTLVELLGAHPEVLSTLLAIHGTPAEAPLIPTTDTLARTLSLERRVDRAYVIGARDHPRGFILLEIQLNIDPSKGFDWALYLELGRSLFHCEGALVILTISKRVRRWIERAIVPPSGILGATRSLRPIVIALDEIDRAELLRPDRPHLAPIAVAAHVEADDALSVGEEAIRITMDHLPRPLALAQLDAILGIANEALRARLEERIMETRKYKSDFFQRMHDQSKAEGLAEGKAEGLAEGKAEGLAEGKAEGLAGAILAVLKARRIQVSDTLRARILGCTDERKLNTWLARAAVARSATEVVRTTGTRKAPAKKAGSSSKRAA